MDFALLTDAQYGIWGGTNYRERTMIRKKIKRAKCLRCRNPVLLTNLDSQICPGCGLSWQTRI